MSEFQLGLLGIGIAVVIAVIVFNKWQEIRYRRQSEMSFQSDRADVLVDPAIATENSAYEQHLARDGDAIFAERPASGPVSSFEKDLQVSPAQEEKSSISAAIHLIAEISGANDLSIRDLDMAALPDRIASRIFIEGLLEGVWVSPMENMRYPRLNVALQLVSRQGPVSMPDLEVFAAWVNEVAARSGATVADMDLDAAHRSAIALEKFCEGVDIQIAVHVVSGSTVFPGTRIRAIAESAALVLESDGKFRRRDDDGRELFRLSNEAGEPFLAEKMRELSTPSVILEYDVARSPGGNHAFAKFRQFSEHLASGLEIGRAHV